MNNEQQIIFNVSQSIAQLRNAIYNSCSITSQQNQQIILINMQSLLERITNETIREQVTTFINDFGGLLRDCSPNANIARQNLLNRISVIILNYYNTLQPLIFVRTIYVRRTHTHPHPNPVPPPPAP